MSLSSGFSDIHWDRINARVEHLLEVISSSPTLHKRINSADFVDMGAHFYVFPQNSWPKQIDTVHDNTTCTQAYHEANMTKDSKTPSLPTLPGHGTESGALPPTPILTATQRAPYLLAEEFTGLMINRQRDEQRKHREEHRSEASPSSTRESSPTATLSERTSTWCTATRIGQKHDSVSPRNTSPSLSVTASEQDARSAGKGPESPRPWSEFDRKNDESNEEENNENAGF